MSARAKLALLGLLYFAQGLPFGFQGRALTLHLRDQGWSLAAVGLASALSLPWLLKPLAAPLVDRFGSTRFGRRRSWIVPVQALLALACLAAAQVTESLHALVVCVLIMNVCAALQDIAVDGLAVDLLAPGDLGAGNGAQVAGYKVGMLVAGGILVWAVGDAGLDVTLYAMAGMVALVLGCVLALREPPPAPRAPGEPRPTLLAIARLGLALFRTRSHRWLVLAVATYKLGESLNDAMFKHYLNDAGLPREALGLWQGVFGMLASIAGSLAGAHLAQKLPLGRALAVTGAARVPPLALQAALAAGLLPLGAGSVVTIVCLENFCGGALTTVMFATMMAAVDTRAGATQFTVLAAIEVGGKAPAAALAGVLAQAVGFPITFALGAAISAAFLALVPRLRRAT